MGWLTKEKDKKRNIPFEDVDKPGKKRRLIPGVKDVKGEEKKERELSSSLSSKKYPLPHSDYMKAVHVSYIYIFLFLCINI